MSTEAFWLERSREVLVEFWRDFGLICRGFLPSGGATGTGGWWYVLKIPSGAPTRLTPRPVCGGAS